MKKIELLLILSIIFVIQGSDLHSMKRTQEDRSCAAYAEDCAMEAAFTPMEQDCTPKAPKKKKYPNIQELGCYKMLISLLESPSQEGFKIKAACCVSGCNTLIQGISSKIKDSEEIGELIEIKEAFVGKLAELREQLNPTGIDDVISQFELLAV